MSRSSADAAGHVQALLDLPEVGDAVAAARAACTRLRWHEALRRRAPQAGAESRVRGATATALLEGAELAGSVGSVTLVRDLARGATPWPVDPGPLERTVKAAVQVTAQTEYVDAAALRSPAQVLARLHVAAAADLLPAAQVGRPRRGAERCAELPELGAAPDPDLALKRMQLVDELLRAVGSGVSTLLVAALVHAEVVTVRPFVHGNALVARALERVVVRAGGLDPTGVAVVESGHAAKAGADYRGALGAYGQGGAEGVRLWLLHCAEGVVTAASEGHRVADAVLAGRLTSAGVARGGPRTEVDPGLPEE